MSQRISKTATIAIALLVLLAALLPGAFAQTIVSGDVAGVVTDPSGAVVPNATLTIKSLATGETKSATTGKSGDFRFSLLRPGTYTLDATASGFAKNEKQVTVDLGQIQNVKIQLGVQAQTQVVEVSEATSLLQSENANLATTYDSVQLQNLPSPGNDMTAYAITTPGVLPSTGSGYGSFTAFGMPASSNLFTVNGLDNDDPFFNIADSGASNLTLGANEIAEMAVVMNGYTGQYGRQAGAQINYVTKTGGNALHGNLAFDYNGRDLNANDWFNNASGTPRPFAISRSWAASLGGPIVKNKLFFFVNNEGLRYVLPGGGPVWVPTTAFATAVLNNLKVNNPAAVPLYTNALNVYAGSPQAGQAVPTSKAQDPNLGCGDLVTGQFGITQPCSAQFYSSANSLNTEYLVSTRVDYNINANHKIFVRFYIDRGVQATSNDAINKAFSANSIQPSDNAQFGYTASFGPRMVNQLNISASYYSAIFGPPNLPAALAVFPTNFVFTDGSPFTNLGGGGNGGNTDFAWPEGRNVRQAQIVDDFAISSGSQTVKFGVNARRVGMTDFDSQSGASGQYVFNSMTDFYNGSLANGSTYTQDFVNSGAGGVRNYSMGFYGQDEWRVKQNLSVTIAIRLDRNTNINCVNDCFYNLQTPFGPMVHNPAIPYDSIIHSTANAFAAINPIVPEPRVGFAWSPTKSTVIRGGVGIFTDLYQALLADRYLENAPAIESFTASSGTVASAGTAKSAQAAVAGSAAAFLTGFNGGATLAQLQSSVPGFSTPNFNAVGNVFNNPTYYQWNFEVQQGLGDKASISLNYVGNHGNQETLQNLYENAYAANGFGGLPTTAPDPRFAEIRDLYSTGYSNYDGLVTTVKWHVSSQFQGSFSYVWSHSLDTCSNNCLEPYYISPAFGTISFRYQTSPYINLSYSNSDYDTRHAVNANYVYTPKVPWNNPLAKQVLGGWTVAGTLLYHTGYPYSIVDTSVRGDNGVGNLAGLATDNVLADWTGGANGYPSCTTPNQQCYTASSRFASANSQHDFGNIPRNSFRGPGYFDTDINIMKSFAIREHYRFQFGISAFNLFNHPNFDLPGNNTASGAFGTIESTVSAASSPYGSFQGSAVSGRIVQAQAKFNF